MNSANQSQYGKRSPEGKTRSPLAFRFSKEKRKNSEKASPFTEMPEELRASRFSLGGLLRKLFNSLLLFILVAALLALVAAFAYQMINDPEALTMASYHLVNNMQSLLQSLVGTR